MTMSDRQPLAVLRGNVITAARNAGYELEPVFCAHGKATSWTGTAGPGMVLPEAEWCPICNPDAIPIDDEVTP